VTQFRKFQYERDQHKATLPAVNRALKSPSLSFYEALLAHSLGGNLATRPSKFVQMFAHSWQAIAFGAGPDFQFWKLRNRSSVSLPTVNEEIRGKLLGKPQDGYGATLYVRKRMAGTTRLELATSAVTVQR
jgi:hypothetical protein